MAQSCLLGIFAYLLKIGLLKQTSLGVVYLHKLQWE